MTNQNQEEIKTLLEVGKEYGLRGINLFGCIDGQQKGYKGAMRPSAHSHCSPKYPKCLGWICFKGGIKHALSPLTNKPTQLFWHEVAHLYRRSWTQQQCDKWAWSMVRR